MRILSFDTSGYVVSVALLESGNVIAGRQITSKEGSRQVAGSVLLPQIDELLSEAGWDKSQIQLLVSGVGPGGFTGIRVGVITARTMAQVLAVPVIGINSLEARAFSVDLPAIVAIYAGGESFYAGRFERSYDERFVVSTDAGYYHFSDLPVLASGLNIIVFGDGHEQLGKHAIAHVNGDNQYNLAGLQGQLAWTRISFGGQETKKLQLVIGKDSPFSWQNLYPVYMRSPSVTLKNHVSQN